MLLGHHLSLVLVTLGYIGSIGDITLYKYVSIGDIISSNSKESSAKRKQVEEKSYVVDINKK